MLYTCQLPFTLSALEPLREEFRLSHSSAEHNPTVTPKISFSPIPHKARGRQRV